MPLVLIEYPDNQSYTVRSLESAFSKLLPAWTICKDRSKLDKGKKPDLQWSDYDELDWDEAMDEPDRRMVNSYAIRKALIRKNHLAHTISMYLSKNPNSHLQSSTIKTFYFNLSYPDEMDELLQDELYEVNESFENGHGTWWILKAALADKGQGIRLFNNREMLDDILEEFEIESDDEHEEDTEGLTTGYRDDTRVSMSTMREWVIQEYISNPLLLDPSSSSNTTPRKFHLRVYVLAVGGLKVYVHHPYLALFAPKAYTNPSTSETTQGNPVDLAPHLTNTCLQTSSLEEGVDPPSIAVSLLQELAEKNILGGPLKGQALGKERIREIEKKVQESVAELFKATVSSGSGFQVMPNAFEIFGLDFLIDEDLNVFILEVNACPDFTQTGTEFQGVVDLLFEETIKSAVVPFFDKQKAQDGIEEPIEKVTEAFRTLVHEQEGNLVKVLDMQVSKAW